jgi:hypothetical protein
MNDTILQPFDGLFDCPWREGLGGLFVVVLGEQLTRLGKQHRENQSGSHDHNRPEPIPPTRVLLLCIGRWWIKRSRPWTGVAATRGAVQ